VPTHKASNASFLSSLAVDQERLRPLCDFLWIGISALSCVQCFDTVVRQGDLACEKPAQNPMEGNSGCVFYLLLMMNVCNV